MKQSKIPIARLLKDFRDQYNLTQLSAAKWCYLAAGTYRDYEQGRSEPTKIIEVGIRTRIADYAKAYEDYIAKKMEDEHDAALEAALA